MFLELSYFFDDPADVGNLISGSSAFSKSTLNIWKFMVHRQLYIYMQKKEDEPLPQTIHKIKSSWIMHLLTARAINSIHEKCLHTCLFLGRVEGAGFPHHHSVHQSINCMNTPSLLESLVVTYRHGSDMKQHLRMIGTAISNAYTGNSSEKSHFYLQPNCHSMYPNTPIALRHSSHYGKSGRG